MVDQFHDDDDSFASSFSEDDLARMEVMERIRQKFIGSERSKKLAQRITFIIERLYMIRKRASEGPKLPMQARQLILIGESGAGKTTELVRNFLKNSAFPGYGVFGSGCPLVTVEAPGKCTMKRLGREILREIGYPLERDYPVQRVWELVDEKLQLAGVRVLHIDEAHNITRSFDADEAEEIKKSLKYHLNSKRHPVSFIISGLPEIEPFFTVNREMRNRCRFLRFDSLGDGDRAGVYANLLAYAAIAGLEVEADAEHVLVPRIMHAALQQVGRTFELMQDAIDCALRDKATTLTVGNFADAFAEWTDNSAGANPFLVSDWSSIDCSRVLSRGDASDEIPGSAEPKKKRGRRRTEPEARPPEDERDF